MSDKVRRIEVSGGAVEVVRSNVRGCVILRWDTLSGSVALSADEAEQVVAAVQALVPQPGEQQRVECVPAAEPAPLAYLRAVEAVLQVANQNLEPRAFRVLFAQLAELFGPKEAGPQERPAQPERMFSRARKTAAGQSGEAHACRCPTRPYYSFGSLASGSATEEAGLRRWEVEHGHHLFAMVRDELAGVLQGVEGTVGSGEAVLDMVHDVFGLPRCGQSATQTTFPEPLVVVSKPTLEQLVKGARVEYEGKPGETLIGWVEEAGMIPSGYRGMSEPEAPKMAGAMVSVNRPGSGSMVFLAPSPVPLGKILRATLSPDPSQEKYRMRSQSGEPKGGEHPCALCGRPTLHDPGQQEFHCAACGKTRPEALPCDDHPMMPVRPGPSPKPVVTDSAREEAMRTMGAAMAEEDKRLRAEDSTTPPPATEPEAG